MRNTEKFDNSIKGGLQEYEFCPVSQTYAITYLGKRLTSTCTNPLMNGYL